MEITSLEKRTQVFVALVFILVSGLGSVLWSVISGMGDSLKGQGKDLEKLDQNIEVKFEKVNEKLNMTVLGVAKAQEHNLSHDLEKEIWIQRIMENVEGVSDNRQSIANFKTKVSARKDPFSGTQGRELQKYIDANRARIVALEKDIQSLLRYLGKL